MSIKLKPQDPYWVEFSSYQTFQTVDEMIYQIKLFEKRYILTPAIKAVLNTIKLHAKKIFIGVCWMKREAIAKKAKVSLASVKRAIKELKEAEILSVYPHIHTKRGGQAHNIYVINPIFEPSIKPANEPPVKDICEPENLTAPTVCESQPEPYKNPHTNLNTRTKDSSKKKNDILRNIPKEFITLMEPFYANNPELIRKRWVTVCVAVKKNCVSLSNTSWDSIRSAWKDSVRAMKRGRLKDRTDDGLGGYFYGVLCDYLFHDFLCTARMGS